jgi:site-specific recombinase XerD
MLSISIIIANIDSKEINVMESPKTIFQAIEAYLHSVSDARSTNTYRTYRNALNLFCQVLAESDLSPYQAPPTELSENAITWFASTLKDFAPATERLYLTAVTGFYEYLSAEQLSTINLPRLRFDPPARSPAGTASAAVRTRKYRDCD